MSGYGALLREARKAAGLSQGELAEALVPVLGADTDHSLVSRIEGESRFVEPSVANKLFAILPTLRPVQFIHALGYDLLLPRKDSAIPPALVRLCENFDDDQLRVLLRVARGLSVEGRDRRTAP